MPDRLCLLSVHAHPDDEASKGAPTVARYHAEGVRTVLVCCTGGEEGDILNPAMDTPEVRADIGRVRMAELKAATDIIGYDETVLLGYRDSGMPDTEANARPDSFAQAPLDEAVGATRGRHPPRAPAGDHHLRRQPDGVPAPGPSAGARDLGHRLRRRRRSGPLPRRRPAVHSEQALLLSVVRRALPPDPREVRGARTRRRPSTTSGWPA